MFRLSAISKAPRLVQSFDTLAFTRVRRHVATTTGTFRSTIYRQQQLPPTTRLAPLLERPWGQPPSPPSGRRQKSSSSTKPVGFQVGDVVLVPENPTKHAAATSSLKQGVITYISRGWYTVYLQEETIFGPVKVKCRSQHLQYYDPSTTTTQPQEPSLSSSSTTSQQQEQQQQQPSPPHLQPFLSQDTIVHMDVTEIQPLIAPPPPPPTIFNLDQALREQLYPKIHPTMGDVVLSTRDQIYLQQVAHHATFTKWVIFTDLHCSPSSLTTCLEVMRCVHQMAVERNAGVLFLGDWWHHRGTLRVDCVNAVLEELSTWQVPMILIPGNHDQVTLGGHDHGLTVLENAYRVVERSSHNRTTKSKLSKSTMTAPPRSFPGPLVFSYPTLFQKALFIPHIRDNAIMESVLLSPEATQQATSIFCHVDVKGALMNDMIRSEGGVAPHLFPTHIPIYSGHFHKPHTMARRNNETPIEYLGSPYQTSLSEAQQDKALVVVDASQNWTCIERIPIEIGPRHYKVYSISGLLDLKPGAPIEKSDRVILTVSKDQMANHQDAYPNGDVSPLDQHIKELRDIGASVEIRRTKFLSAEALGENRPTSSEIEEMLPSTTWKTFLSAQLERESVSNKTFETLLMTGLQILEKLDVRSEEEDSPVEKSRKHVSDLQLHSVKMEGFGPFHKPVVYPLHDRGLVLVRGTNKDGGSDSNGSGKSSLAMAALWALTGSIDPRPTSDSRTADIINDNSKVAKVSVNGLLNGEEFTITRMKAASKGQLSFLLGGKDLTTQSAKETQQIINEKLGVGPEILARTIFHGQHTMNGLLESTDTKLKEELSLVVPLELWQDAVSHCRAKARDASKNGAQIEGMLQIRTGELSKLEARLKSAKADLESKQESLKTLEEKLQSERHWIADRFDTSASEPISSDMDAIKVELDTAAEDISLVVQKQLGAMKDRDEEIHPLEARVSDLARAFDSAKETQRSCERQVELAQLRAESSKEAIRTMEAKWNVKLEKDALHNDFAVPSICPTCLQPIEAGVNHSHETIKQVLDSDISNVLENARTNSRALEEASAALDEASQRLAAVETQLKGAQQETIEAKTRWDSVIASINEELSIKRAAQEALSAQFTSTATLIQRSTTAKQLEVAVAGAQQAVQSALTAYNVVNDDYKEVEAKHKELMVSLDEEKKVSDLMSELVDAFGARGVQAFVLQSAVDVLQTTSQAYLNDLSEGSIQLRLSIDAGDRISRTAFVRTPNGDYVERPLASLSGGQWRRCSIALSLGFADLVATRGRMRPSLCVFDEPLTFLDTSGRAAVGRLFRSLLRRPGGGVDSTKLSLSTILIILQDLAAEELEEAFDRIDEVVKEGGSTSVKVDEIEK